MGDMYQTLRMERTKKALQDRSQQPRVLGGVPSFLPTHTHWPQLRPEVGVP